MFDPDSYREQSLRTWGEMAPGWRDRNDWMMSITGVVNDWLVEHADPQPGQRFLEVACGAGDLGCQVADRVGDEGHVISTDFAPEMVEVAGNRGNERGSRTSNTGCWTPSRWTSKTTVWMAWSAVGATC